MIRRFKARRKLLNELSTENTTLAKQLNSAAGRITAMSHENNRLDEQAMRLRRALGIATDRWKESERRAYQAEVEVTRLKSILDNAISVAAGKGIASFYGELR